MRAALAKEARGECDIREVARLNSIADGWVNRLTLAEMADYGRWAQRPDPMVDDLDLSFPTPRIRKTRWP